MMMIRGRLAKRQQREVKALKRGVAAAAVLATLVFGAGFYQGEGVLVEDSYTVQQGDVLREISEEYLAKNTYSRRYILEFEDGIHELNPWIRQRGLQPGDVVRINYWVKATEGGEN